MFPPFVSLLLAEYRNIISRTTRNTIVSFKIRIIRGLYIINFHDEKQSIFRSNRHTNYEQFAALGILAPVRRQNHYRLETRQINKEEPGSVYCHGGIIKLTTLNCLTTFALLCTAPFVQQVAANNLRLFSTWRFQTQRFFRITLITSRKYIACIGDDVF